MPFSFPSPPTIPARHFQPVFEGSRRFLVDGEIRTWGGHCSAVESCVMLREGSSEPRRHLLGELPQHDAETALEGLEGAVRAWDRGRGEWPTMEVRGRLEAVRRFASAMKERREACARLIMWEIGKTLKDAEKEFDRTVEYIEATLQALKELDRAGNRFSIDGGIVGMIRRAPLGVTLCLGPFNYPLNETFATLIPAIIMGNPVVMKLPRYGALCVLPLLEAFRDSFPRGVVNTVSGDGATTAGAIQKSGKVDVLAFIGSSRAADALKLGHPAPHRLRCITGLGAKNPAFVLPDADLDLAVAECLSGALSFNGQRCTALKHLFVHRSLADAFVSRLADAVSRLPLGLPWEDGARITPLPEHGKPDRLRGLVEDAVSKGARIVNAGGAEHRGTWFRPAVVAGVTSAMQLWSVEQFGPVVPVSVYDGEEELFDYVVQSPYGQQASIFGRDAARVGPLVDAMMNQLCRINLNAACQRGPDSFPFTGRKGSAEGTLSVSDALRAFSIRAMVAAKEGSEQVVSEILMKRTSRFLRTDFIF
ncbi:MAG: aldehyde dehydrogenase family protein [Candidatus Brocadiae bacterium]|nr:aldehyde dehydrogenase family protein [Candidatus Brocadiia bacterium]